MPPCSTHVRGNVSTWLLTITRNLALDALRLRRAVPVDPVVLATLDLPAGEPLPGGEVVLPAELQRLRAALAALPAEQRRAFLLAAYGLSAREIGERDDVRPPSSTPPARWCGAAPTAGRARPTTVSSTWCWRRPAGSSSPGSRRTSATA